MHVVWFSWKDIAHPEAGGAELVSDSLRNSLIKDGHEVTLITSRYAGSTNMETVGGVNILRGGNKFSVYVKALNQYRRLHSKCGVDLVVDEMNTLPFFTFLYTRGIPRVLLTYQLARSVWFYQMPFPVSILGYVLEPAYLFLISKRYTHVITESNSTKSDLIKFGFSNRTINIFRVGMKLSPLSVLPPKRVSGKILFLGAMRPMKRPLEAIKSFEHARNSDPSLTLDIAGDNTGAYGNSVMNYIANSKHRRAIRVHGRVDDRARLQLLRESDIILVTSVKEGWGLIVTEANSQGTPAIAYNADGLRDSVVNKKTGLLVEIGNSFEMGKAITRLISNPSEYERIRNNAYEYSKQFTFENSYNDFIKILSISKGKKNSGH